MPTKFHQPVTVDSLVTQGTAKLKITHADLTAAATSQVITFNTLAAANGGQLMPAKSRVMYAWINLLTEFSGGAVSALVVKLGDAGSDNASMDGGNFVPSESIGTGIVRFAFAKT